MANFREKIEKGDSFLITCEISPPRGPNTESFEERLKEVRGKVDAVNLTDNPMLSVRMTPVVASLFAIKNGIEPIMQITCRDRNILGITSDLIGAWAIGVRNVLALWGDMPKEGKPKGVFEVDTTELIKLITDLGKGLDFRGNEINSRCDFFVGAALNPFDEPEKLKENAEKKISAGARFFQTQPVFDLNSITHFADFVYKNKINVLLGVIITPSEKTLENIKKFAKGMVIPEELEENLKKYESKEDKEKVAVEFCSKLIEKIKQTKVFRGVHIYSPTKESLIGKLLEFLPV
jgi:methylenetetrahydrofolate reductase (NADPH)